ncbi:MAG: hypothetical protein Q9171_007172 [Xanthocarpia ochracea]
MHAATLIDRSRASLDLARQTLETVGTAVRDRASSLNVRSFYCWSRGEGIGLSRSFTASVQPLSARRIDIDGSASSPTEMQQFRYPAFGGGSAAMQERFVVGNGDPSRDDEYLSISSRQPSPENQAVSSNPPYVSVSKMWAGNNGRNATLGSVFGEEEEEEEFPTRNKAQHAIANTTSSSQEQPQRTTAAKPETSIPLYQFDAELHLAYLIQKGIEARNFAITDLLASPQQPPANFTPQRRQPRNIPGEAGRRKGRVFDPVTDYTQPPFNNNEGISSQSTGQQLEQRAIPGLVPARRALPRSPPAAPVECIPAKVIDVPPERGTARRREDYKPQPTILMSMYRPVIGDFGPSPLNVLSRDVISTTTTVLPTSSTSFPYPPVSPPQPSPTHSTNHPRLQNLAPGLIFTDAEFPRDLSRDGPGSRFPAHLVHQQPPLRRIRRDLPDMVFTSPVDTSRSDPSSSAADFVPSYQNSSCRHIPYTPSNTTEPQLTYSSDGGSHPSGLRDGVVLQSPAQTPQPYLSTPHPRSPNPILTTTTTSVSTPQPNININTETKTKTNNDNDDPIIQAIALNLIHFASPPPPPPSHPAPTLPPHSSTPPPSPHPPASDNVSAGNIKRTISPASSIMSRASEIREIVERGGILYD